MTGAWLECTLSSALTSQGQMPWYTIMLTQLAYLNPFSVPLHQLAQALLQL